ncbi:major facilitator superfamily domain-containing protein [Protomyces lactucae-debilis]|uniref:Major facilitator superfamily domain-containing protein n=1 Tax=Protomyces lactucae-debilis TaxID=2754530 RepID=A0A1Y2FL84_PROLT|nr:major facilitator superfamily domain-containing protein [Protomyces lactucae-debilis]ORY84752.1 major facilitator superfamily domain-containing protein [Protomyces lactucae-debilis]
MPQSRRASFDENLELVEPSPVNDPIDDGTKRLIQARPVQLRSQAHEVLFILICASGSLLTNIAFGNMTVSLLDVQKSLDLDETELPWLQGAYALANGSFVLVFGGLADSLGAKRVFICGCLWLAIWSLVAGLASSPIQLFVSRAMQGISGGALVPSGLALLGYVYEPGRRKNRVFSIYGAAAPIGFIIGAAEAGVCIQVANWRWTFYINSILVTLVAIAAWFSIPPDEHPVGNLRRFDWLGSGVAIAGIVLVVFGLTDGPVAHWTPYTYGLLIVGVLLLALFVWIEKKVSDDPVMPLEMWSTPSFGWLMAATVLGWGGYACWQFYAGLFWLKVTQASPLLTAAYFSPNAVFGVVATMVCASTLHILPGHYIFGISGMCFSVGPALFVLLSYKPHLSYWAAGFPALIFTTFGPDLSFSSASIFVTSHVKRKYQGSAGSVLNAILQVAMSLAVGLGGIVESQVVQARRDPLNPDWQPSLDDVLASYRAVWWFSLALSLASLLMTLLFVRIEKTSEKKHLA